MGSAGLDLRKGITLKKKKFVVIDGSVICYLFDLRDVGSSYDVRAFDVCAVTQHFGSRRCLRLVNLTCSFCASTAAK